MAMAIRFFWRGRGNSLSKRDRCSSWGDLPRRWRRRDPRFNWHRRVTSPTGCRNAPAMRQLGRAFLLRNDLTRAAQRFQRSVEISPASVMAHQNAAARYDVEHYVPCDWELAYAGKLLIYDNYVQLGEDFYGRGRPADAFRYYQNALDYQDYLRSLFPLPQSLRNELTARCAAFDPGLPICLLGYEWVTQLGHIGFLDLNVRIGQTRAGAQANHVLLAPDRKIANPAPSLLQGNATHPAR
jgi:tetratricopeptide (TPR) repeat protein